jgi:peptidoglycan LD-endopeptidase LytH
VSLTAILKRHRAEFHPVVPFDAGWERLCPMDFTDSNTALSPDIIADTDRFATWINATLLQHNARYGVGGYGEHRTLYARSRHFDQPLVSSPRLVTQQSDTPGAGKPYDTPGAGRPYAAGSESPRTEQDEQEPRRFHLGVDIWGPVGTKVMAPLDGVLHSFAFNNNDSDYGATLILTHNLEGCGFHTLYGHLSLNSLKNLYEGMTITRGEVIAEFGMRFENGNWPPHLHFQVITDMEGWKGDYPGVCRFSERQQWLDNCPDPNLILQMEA